MLLVIPGLRFFFGALKAPKFLKVNQVHSRSKKTNKIDSFLLNNIKLDLLKF